MKFRQAIERDMKEISLVFSHCCCCCCKSAVLMMGVKRGWWWCKYTWNQTENFYPFVSRENFPVCVIEIQYDFRAPHDIHAVYMKWWHHTMMLTTPNLYIYRDTINEWFYFIVMIRRKCVYKHSTSVFYCSKFHPHTAHRNPFEYTSKIIICVIFAYTRKPIFYIAFYAIFHEIWVSFHFLRV